MKLKNANRTQNLLTDTVMRGIPLIGAGKYESAGPSKAYLKFFLESFTWFLAELDPKTLEAYGKVYSSMCPEGEYGYFSVAEIAKTCGRYGQGVERDKWFKPCPLSEVKNPCLG